MLSIDDEEEEEEKKGKLKSGDAFPKIPDRLAEKAKSYSLSHTRESLCSEFVLCKLAPNSALPQLHRCSITSTPFIICSARLSSQHIDTQ